MFTDDLPIFEPPTQSPTRTSVLLDRLRRFRTIRFHQALRDSDIRAALSSEFRWKDAVDNSVGLLVPSSNPVQLWSRMTNAVTIGQTSEFVKMYDTVLKLICGTGGAKYLNEPDDDGYRPIDVARPAQLFVLIRRTAELGVDLNPTMLSSPLYGICDVGYHLHVYKMMLAAMDPAFFDSVDPTTGRTPLYALCRRIQTQPDPNYLHALDLLLACIGYVNPTHRIFSDQPISHPMFDAQLTAARFLTADYIESDFLPALRIIDLPRPILRIVVNFAF